MKVKVLLEKAGLKRHTKAVHYKSGGVNRSLPPSNRSPKVSAVNGSQRCGKYEAELTKVYRKYDVFAANKSQQIRGLEGQFK